MKKVIGFKDECNNVGIYNNMMDYEGGPTDADELIDAINENADEQHMIERKNEFATIDEAYRYVYSIADSYYTAYRAYLEDGGYVDMFGPYREGGERWDMEINFTMIVEDEESGAVEEIELPYWYTSKPYFAPAKGMEEASDTARELYAQAVAAEMEPMTLAEFEPEFKQE